MSVLDPDRVSVRVPATSANLGPAFATCSSPATDAADAGSTNTASVRASNR